MRFVTGLAAGAGIGYALGRRHRTFKIAAGTAPKDRAVWSRPAPPLPETPGHHGGTPPPPGGGAGPVLGEAVRPASLQGAPAGDALLLLAREHDELREEIESLRGWEPGGPHESGDLRAAVQRVVSAASRHEAAEEEHFWPLVRTRLPGGDGLAETGRTHELELKRILQALDSRRPGDIDFGDLLTELKGLVDDHVAFEEGQVWPLLDSTMTEAERVELGGHLSRAEELAPTRPHPSEFADPSKHPAISRAVAMVDRGVDRASARGRGPHD